MLEFVAYYSSTSKTIGHYKRLRVGKYDIPVKYFIVFVLLSFIKMAFTKSSGNWYSSH